MSDPEKRKKQRLALIGIGLIAEATGGTYYPAALAQAIMIILESQDV